MLLFILNRLQVHSSLKALLIHHLLLKSIDLAVAVLIIKLVFERIISPLYLAVVCILHFLDYLLGLFRAVVRLVVLLVVQRLGVPSLLDPVTLDVDKVLILLHRGLSLITGLTHLSL